MNQRIDIFSQKLRQNLWKWMSFRNRIRNEEIYLDRKCDYKNWIIKFFGKWKRFTRNKRIPKKRERFFPRDFLMDPLSLLFLLFELSSKVGDTTRKKEEEEVTRFHRGHSRWMTAGFSSMGEKTACGKRVNGEGRFINRHRFTVTKWNFVHKVLLKCSCSRHSLHASIFRGGIRSFVDR